MFQNFKREIKLFLLVALIAAIVSVAGILLLKAMQPGPVGQTPIPPAPSPQPKAVDTSNWQTYRSDEFGFEVKYPNDWSIYDTDTASELKSVAFRKEPSGEGFDMFSRAVSIIIEPNPKRHIPTIEWYKNEWAKQIPAGINFDNVKFEETTFQELPALKASNTVFFARGLYMFRAEWGVIDYGNADAQLVQLTEQTFNQILATFRFVKDGSVFKGVPTTYEQCAKTGKNYLLGSTGLECKYSVSYSDNDETNKDKYLECQKIGGIVSSLHGDSFDSSNPPVYIYMCDLNFYNPNYQFPRTFEECRDSKAQWLRTSIDSQERCNIAIENITHFNKDIANNLMDKCIALGGSYTKYLNPRFARTQCVIWFDKK